MSPWVAQLRAREQLCRRAPSAHNTQPWVLRYRTDEVEIRWDETGTLPAGDPTRRDLFLSLGTFVETCLVVAADAGLAVRAEVAVDEATRVVARLLPAACAYATPFDAGTVRRRRCARGPYHPGAVDPAVVVVLRRLGVDVRPLRGGAVAPLLQRADRWLFSTPDVVGELRAWLRLSPRHGRYHLDGLTDRALALSRAQALALGAALATHRVGRRIGVPALIAAASLGLVRPDDSVLVLVGRVGGPDDLVHHGRALMRTWLGLTDRGLFVHPLSQLLDCPAAAVELRTLLGLAAPESALAAFRVGRPVDEPAWSARRPM